MMEEILKRMMAAEKEAATMVRAAQKEADAQVLEARRQAASLLANREGDIEAACAELLKTRDDAARQARQATEEDLEHTLNQQLTDFKAKLESRKRDILEALAYPSVP